MNFFARGTAIENPPPRTIADVENEITEVDSELTRVGRDLHAAFAEHPEDVPMRGAFRLSTSRPPHPAIVALQAKRSELLARWPVLLREYSDLKP